uniref:uncharacterized protein LOC122579026 n=1 Tax=Erigeron canadensis TaxID=72917 RepID=UPI001CB9393C|nr:uncharacterized protein LOC122579026 [Erigeron canadensis]
MMGRVKTRMEFITSDKKRKSVFETRSNCIKKKAKELSTLCAINVGLIVTDPTTSSSSSSSSSSSDTNIKTYAWPNNNGDRILLDDMITRYKNQGSVKRKRTNVEGFLGNDETQVYPTPKLDLKYEEMSEQELRKLATFLQHKVEKVKERIQYIRPQLVDFNSDDDADLTYLLGQILDNPMTPTIDDLPPLHDTNIDFDIPWSKDLPLLVDPTTNSSSADISYSINLQSGHQLIETTPDFQPAITQYPYELESFSYYLNKPPPQYFDAPIFCQPTDPQTNTSSLSHLNSNSSVWSMPLLS